MLHIKNIKPLFTSVLVTGDRYEEDMLEHGLIVSKKGDLKLYQKVLAVGSSVRDLQVGDKVMFSPKNYAIMRYDDNSVKNDMGMNKVIKWNLPWVTIDDKDGNPIDCLLLQDRDIEFVFEGEEVFDKLVIPDKKIVLN